MGVTFNPYSIVTELLDTSLFAVLHQQRRVLTPQQQVHVALGVARGLASLHGHAVPIVHRDIKSLNSQGHTHATVGRSAAVAAVCLLPHCSLHLPLPLLSLLLLLPFSSRVQRSRLCQGTDHPSARAALSPPSSAPPQLPHLSAHATVSPLFLCVCVRFAILEW